LALNKCSLCLEPGKVHALIGPSGAGKSTVLSMLTRLYTPLTGEIYLDNTNIQDMAAAEFFGLVSVVEQEARIFNRTIFENIAYGVPNITLSEVEEVAKAVNIHDYIINLPQAYSTILGTGHNLSGGQKQRICIARAFAKKPKIILLDEPTNGLDVENENLILELVYTNAKKNGATVLFITHHIPTIQKADEIHFLQNGIIHEHGTHEELVAIKGLYFNFLQIISGMTGADRMKMK